MNKSEAVKVLREERRKAQGEIADLNEQVKTLDLAIRALTKPGKVQKPRKSPRKLDPSVVKEVWRRIQNLPAEPFQAVDVGRDFDPSTRARAISDLIEQGYVREVPSEYRGQRQKYTVAPDADITSKGPATVTVIGGHNTAGKEAS